MGKGIGLGGRDTFKWHNRGVNFWVDLPLVLPDNPDPHTKNTVMSKTTRKKKQSDQFAKWCFTENDDPWYLYDNMEVCFEMSPKHIRYICGQIEVCPSTGKEHLQGYIQLYRNYRIAWLKMNVSESAHFEAQRAIDNNDARDYCMKSTTSVIEGPFKEVGVFCEGPGSRTDLHYFKDRVESGDTVRTLIHDQDGMKVIARYPKFYDRIRSLCPPIRDNYSDFQVEIFYGTPGSGKTRKAYEENPDLYVLPLVNSTLWFDGYDLHKTVLLDDFNGSASKVGLDFTLRLLDRYVVQVPIKGGHTWWCPNKIIVTTNIHPRDWYDWAKREIHYEALMRRVTKVYVFTKDSMDEWDVHSFFNECGATIFL